MAHVFETEFFQELLGKLKHHKTSDQWIHAILPYEGCHFCSFSSPYSPSQDESQPKDQGMFQYTIFLCITLKTCLVYAFMLESRWEKITLVADKVLYCEYICTWYNILFN